MQLITPFSMLVVGASRSGKSVLCKKLILSSLFDRPLTKIYICYAHMQSIYNDIKRESAIPVSFIKGLPKDLKTESGSLVLIDDLQGTHSKEVAEWFTRKYHHQNTSVIYLVQNMFARPPQHRTISLNSVYIVVFKSPRDSSQISNLAKQIAPGQTKFIVWAYKKATRVPHSYLFIDLKQTTDDLLRIRDSFFNSVVYISSEDVTKFNKPRKIAIKTRRNRYDKNKQN